MTRVSFLTFSSVFPSCSIVSFNPGLCTETFPLVSLSFSHCSNPPLHFLWFFLFTWIQKENFILHSPSSCLAPETAWHFLPFSPLLRLYVLSPICLFPAGVCIRRLRLLLSLCLSRILLGGLRDSSNSFFVFSYNTPQNYRHHCTVSMPFCIYIVYRIIHCIYLYLVMCRHVYTCVPVYA